MLPQVPTEPTDATLTVRDGSTIELSVGEPIQNGGEVVDLYQVEWASAPIVSVMQIELGYDGSAPTAMLRTSARGTIYLVAALAVFTATRALRQAWRPVVHPSKHP